MMGPLQDILSSSLRSLGPRYLLQESSLSLMEQTKSRLCSEPLDFLRKMLEWKRPLNLLSDQKERWAFRLVEEEVRLRLS